MNKPEFTDEQKKYNKVTNIQSGIIGFMLGATVVLISMGFAFKK
jgi:hypothetical protein